MTKVYTRRHGRHGIVITACSKISFRCFILSLSVSAPRSPVNRGWMTIGGGSCRYATNPGFLSHCRGRRILLQGQRPGPHTVCALLRQAQGCSYYVLRGCMADTESVPSVGTSG